MKYPIGQWLLGALLQAGLRLPRHRSTTAHLCAAYPFQADAPIDSGGAWLGTDLGSGGAGFAFDPFAAYPSLITNPNIVIAGEPGTGKSTLVKCFLYRAVGVFGRWVAICDPKGEYKGLATALGLDVIDLHPGGHERINPLDSGSMPPGDVVTNQSRIVAALLSTVLHRDLTPVEDAAIGWALDELDRWRECEPTLADLAALLAQPSGNMARKARTNPREIAHGCQAVAYALGKLVDRSLRGMFDGPTTCRLNWDGPGVVIDLSAVQRDPEALAVVMVAVTAWLSSALAQSGGPPRIQVLDEAWALLADPRACRHLQSSWKLGRANGVANLAVIHRFSDLRSQADDGTASAKVAMGLLSDTQTRVVLRQSSDQLDEARQLLGLTSIETDIVGRLCRGRALWKIGEKGVVADLVVGPRERAFCDTDAAMGTA